MGQCLIALLLNSTHHIYLNTCRNNIAIYFSNIWILAESIICCFLDIQFTKNCNTTQYSVTFLACSIKLSFFILQKSFSANRPFVAFFQYHATCSESWHKMVLLLSQKGVVGIPMPSLYMVSRAT